MLNATWSEKSELLANKIELRTNDIIEDLNLDYKVRQGMSGWNNRIVIYSENQSKPFLSFIIGWLNADAEIAIVKNEERVTHEYLQFDNSTYKEIIDKERYEGYLSDNNIKYYPSPFDEIEEIVMDDINTFLARLEKEEVK